jgi:acetylornithine/succinyldiaminopimelate/putrescine aminotransferase
VREGRKSADFVPHGLDQHIFINAARRKTLRLVSPLIISADKVRDDAQRLGATIAAAR